MCGRFSIIKKAEEIIQRFSIKAGADEFIPVYNASPGQNLAVISNLESDKLNYFKWGLIPFWAKEASIGNKMINARVETIAEKPAFRNSLKSKRCLVIADGFYEWKKDNGYKQPFRILMKDESLFAFAGLWDTWKDGEGRGINSFTIITTEANSMMKDIHERMPVILDNDDEMIWLDDQFNTDKKMSILKPYPSEKMKYYPVSSLVNSPVNNNLEVINPINPVS
jgi:putative SOS response-associated peptidase YedK